MIWPFDLRKAVDFHNNTNANEDSKSPQELLSGFNGKTDVKQFHTWGCPFFVLDRRNQSLLSGTPKLDPNAKTGAHLGRLLVSASKVALVLNLATIHVSPRHHVSFDDGFSTVPRLTHNTPLPNWEQLVNRNIDNLYAENSFNTDLLSGFTKGGIESATAEIEPEVDLTRGDLYQITYVRGN